jgi:elongator complex protein 3
MERASNVGPHASRREAPVRPLPELLRPRAAFDPREHERELVPLIDALLASGVRDPGAIESIVREHPRGGKALFSRSEIIAGFRAFAGERGWLDHERDLLRRLRKRGVRTLSGVAPVTVLTKPFPCPGRCIFCPSDVRMPKSYLAREPGAQRATQNRFDPFLQTRERLRAFWELGHPVDKVELIVLGGTWSHYPMAYRIWFVKRCFDALNDFAGARDPGDAAARSSQDFLDLDVELDGAALDRTYNRVVAGHLRQHLEGRLLADFERASWEELARAQERNESAACRNVGLSLETRPDEIDAQEVLNLRRLGATKVQLGFQSLSDAVLSANHRGHDVASTRRAVRRLRAAGFKLQAHWMPNLYRATPAGDREDYARIFDDPDFRPDELKIYPCSLIGTAELARHWHDGSWAPYAEETLIDLVADCLARTPRYCRLTRVIRDISAQDIVAGSRTANLREVAERRLQDRGARSVDVRAREIRDAAFDPDALELRETAYATSIGEERFLEFVTPDDRLLAFMRLSLPRPGFEPELSELGGAAVIRELHAYGALAPLGERPAGAAQHAGLGRRLVERAAGLARASGCSRLAVISAVGTRAYYERLGFKRGALYHHRDLAGE